MVRSTAAQAGPPGGAGRVSRPPTTRRSAGRRGRLLIAGAVALAVGGGASLVTLVSTAGAATAFSATFEDGSTSAWTKSGGTWSVVTDGTKVLQQSKSTSELARFFAGSTSWTDYSLEARVKPLASSNSASLAAIAARATSSTSYVRLALTTAGKAELQVVKSGAVTVVGSASTTVSLGTWYTLKLDVTGSTLTGYVNGTKVASGTGGSSAGQIGLITSYTSASFDDVVVTTGTSTTTTAAPTTTPATTTAAPTTTPASTTPAATTPATTTPASTGTWPTATGTQAVSASISVSGSYDGGMKRFYGTGDLGTASQSEDQGPIFDLAAGATLSNVIIGAPAADGVHCAGPCTLTNVWWEDVGEDAATFRGSSSSNVYTVSGGGAKSASDKVFQHNGAGTVKISNFYVANFGKLYRSCGNCTTQYKRTVYITGVTAATPGSVLAGINTNYGDVAHIYGNTVASGIALCWRYTGNNTGAEPTKTGSGIDGTYCKSS